ncbi:glycosyltransferase family 2 protein [Candidatus Beckwithbacteria bacterium]|nr:glycosyltransferase family 2 protein [Candidatus Beckwithbacteria bacterium]
MNSKNKPKVSIISPSYLHEKYVAKFLNSILAQTFTDFELIIIDDRSLDNTLNIIKSYKDSRIKIIEHHYNMGPSIGFNDGIKNSVGEYIVFIASDDEVCPTYLQEGINYLEKNKQYNALFFQLEGIDENNHLLKDK